MRENARTSRIAAYVASGALVVSGAVVAGSPAEAVTYDPVGVQTASAWLPVQATNGMLQSGYEDGNGDWVLYDDQGLTIDAVESLVETGRSPAAVTAMTDAVEAQADTYASYGSGQIAKLLVLADTVGRDTDTFGGGGLVADLEAQIAPGPGNAGALQNAYDGVLSQALAVRALTDAGSSKAVDAAAFLLKQQCDSGYFRETFTTGAECDEQVDQPSTDTTAVAVIELSGHVSDPAVQSALTQARTWLAGEQAADGSWEGAQAGTGSANSTGLAARALGDSSQSQKAATWLWNHQVRPGATGPLADEDGAIAVDDDTLAAGQAGGLDERSRTLWVRATAQSFPALRWLPSSVTGTLTLRGPSGYLKAGSLPNLRLTGTKAGHVITLRGPGTAVTRTATGPVLDQAVRLPGGTGTRSYVVTDDHGHRATTALKALGPKTLTLTKSRNRVKRGRSVTARISGLAPQERARILYRGRLIRGGLATASGRFGATFKVGRATGKMRIVGYGEFSDIRRGATTIRVVR